MAESQAEFDHRYRAVLGLILEHVHVGVTNDSIVVEDVEFDAPADVRAALSTLMEEWVDGETTDPRTHGLTHAPLPEGVYLDPGFCAGCDTERVVIPPGGQS